MVFFLAVRSIGKRPGRSVATLLVSFAVASTLTVNVRQRAEEMHLLRRAGATPGQLRRMMVGEASIVVLAGAALTASGVARQVPGQRAGRRRRGPCLRADRLGLRYRHHSARLGRRRVPRRTPWDPHRHETRSVRRPGREGRGVRGPARRRRRYLRHLHSGLTMSVEDKTLETLNLVVVGIIVVFSCIMLINSLYAPDDSRRAGEFGRLIAAGCPCRRCRLAGRGSRSGSGS
ncbi:FtsX-like permease family protein [Plantactinospora sp. DSM 117369]